jgi:hypothetical protein
MWDVRGVDSISIKIGQLLFAVYKTQQLKLFSLNKKKQKEAQRMKLTKLLSPFVITSSNLLLNL